MGGGNSIPHRKRRLVRGLSPRGRGKPSPRSRCRAISRSIPAWAGETGQGGQAGPRAGVYPRVGGGNPNRSYVKGGEVGLSPRGRGKLPCAGLSKTRSGSIPAWAGETAGVVGLGGVGQVYPRVGGGNGWPANCTSQESGLSPRGRGKHGYYERLFSWTGSIPAWAGETNPGPSNGGRARVYPRVGGGNEWRKRWTAEGYGLSPRGRGKPALPRIPRGYAGSIPAWAGETARGAYSAAPAPVYPRVGGGNRLILCRQAVDGGLSPRGRGKHQLRKDLTGRPGSIPAWAGETCGNTSRRA